MKGADECNQWLEDLLEACANQAIDQPTLIVDNAPAHARLERFLEHHENVQILRLDPYSYLLNPIELLWSVFNYKSHQARVAAKYGGTGTNAAQWKCRNCGAAYDVSGKFSNGIHKAD